MTSDAQNDRWPRAMRGKTAAEYIGRSEAWLRNTRVADKRAAEEDGTPPVGPPYVVQGRSVFYYREDLDDWLDGFKGVPSQAERGSSDLGRVQGRAAR